MFEGTDTNGYPDIAGQTLVFKFTAPEAHDASLLETNYKGRLTEPADKKLPTGTWKMIINLYGTTEGHIHYRILNRNPATEGNSLPSIKCKV